MGELTNCYVLKSVIFRTHCFSFCLCVPYEKFRGEENKLEWAGV